MNERDGIAFRALGPFLLITFGLAWSILGLYVFFPAPMASAFGPLTGDHPLFFLAVWAPALAALVLVARAGGRSGLGRFLGRTLLWRCSPGWYAFLLLGVPLIFLTGSALRGSLWSEPFPLASWQAALAALGLAVIKGPLEELGWRGVALPLLQRRFTPLTSALMLGAVWGLWHGPAFLLGRTQQSEWSFGVFFAGCLAISVIATALFNRSGGSILLSMLFHFSLMNPLLPDARPWDTGLLIVVAGLVVCLDRGAMLGGRDAVVDVIPGGRRSRGPA